MFRVGDKSKSVGRLKPFVSLITNKKEGLNSLVNKKATISSGLYYIAPPFCVILEAISGRPEESRHRRILTVMDYYLLKI